MFRNLVLTDLKLEMFYWFKFVSVQCIVCVCVWGGGGVQAVKFFHQQVKGLLSAIIG